MKAALVLFFGLLGASVQASENIETTLKYLEALDAENIQALSPLMAEDIKFEDPTFGAVYDGKAQVQKVYGAYAAGVHNIKKLLLSAYESNGAVVTTWVVAGDIDPYSDAEPEHRVPTIAKIVRTLVFRNGEVIRHIDLQDYSKIMPALMAAQEKYALLENRR